MNPLILVDKSFSSILFIVIDFFCTIWNIIQQINKVKWLNLVERECLLTRFDVDALQSAIPLYFVSFIFKIVSGYVWR